MSKYLNFEDLEIWKEGMSICKDIYSLLKDCNDFVFKNQICRSAISIPSNISEGYERKGIKETTQFLYIAKGSCGELRTQLYLAINLNYLSKTNGDNLINKTKRLNVMIYNYIKSINKE